MRALSYILQRPENKFGRSGGDPKKCAICKSLISFLLQDMASQAANLVGALPAAGCSPSTSALRSAVSGGGGGSGGSGRRVHYDHQDHRMAPGRGGTGVEPSESNNTIATELMMTPSTSSGGVAATATGNWLALHSHHRIDL